MRNIIIPAILLFILFDSCDKKRTVEEKIRGKDYKYWLMVRSEPEFEASIEGEQEEMLFYYFDKKGKHFRFYKYNLLGKFRKNYNPYSDIQRSDDWSLDNDSLIIINGLKFYIKSVTEDMLLLYSDQPEEYTLFVTAPEALIPKEFQKMQ